MTLFSGSFVVCLTFISFLLTPNTHSFLHTLGPLLGALWHLKLGFSSPATEQHCSQAVYSGMICELHFCECHCDREWVQGVISLISADCFEMRWTMNSDTFFRVRHSVSIGSSLLSNNDQKKCESPQYFFLLKNPHPFYRKNNIVRKWYVICLRAGWWGESNMGRSPQASLDWPLL